MQFAPVVTEDEYLEFEQGSNSKHEYMNGQIVAMAGARERHNLVASNIATALNNALRDRPCRVLSSDQRVHVETTRGYFYPDVTVVCGRSRYAEKSDLTLTNPTLVVEVLSPSTAAYDRGPKLQHYQRLDALREIVLVDPETRTVEVHARDAGGAWADAVAEGALHLGSVDASVTVADFWAKLDLVGG